MTKTQIKILELGKRSEEVQGIRRYLMRMYMFLLEIVVVLHRIASTFYKGKDATFQAFATRDEHGSFTESYTDHERFRKVSAGSVAFAIMLALVYVSSGIFIPNRVSIRAASYTVTQMNDSGDGLCDSTCTLRDAILNSNSTIGVADAITFDAAGTITLASPLPALTDQLTIDGDVDGNGTPDVVIDGTGITGSGIAITSDGNTIQGLIIQNFTGNGISIQASNNIITGNYIGTNSAGNAAAANSEAGVYINDDGVTPSTGNTIGGSNASTRNIISGNAGQAGVLLDGNLVQGNTISGNYIGTNPAGTGAVPNASYGVLLNNGADNNTIGGNLSGGQPGTGVGNVISGNGGAGVFITNADANNNTIAGNLIGVASDGTTGLGNGDDAIHIDGANSGNTIGGASSDFRNIISGSATAEGIELDSHDNTVQNNYIGLNRAGDAAIPNSTGIITNTGAGNNIRDNVISGNTNDGVRMIAANTTTIAGNTIGLNVAGSAAIANGDSGISISYASHDNTIGGTSASDRNIISGNTGAGVLLGGGGGDQSTTTANIIEGNFIGTNLAGDSAIGNGTFGVSLLGGVESNTIGGTTPGTSCTAACNLLSGNTTAEVSLAGAVHGNAIQGNIIGLNLAETAPIRWANEATGITITGGAYSNTIGGNRDENASEIGQGNVIGGYISDTDHDGAYIGDGIEVKADGYDSGSNTGNSIFGNLIGLNGSGLTQDIFTNATGVSGTDNINDLRSRNGINILAPYTVVGDGTAAHRNAISGNSADIFLKADSGINYVSINGNYIGTDKTGETAQKSGGYTEDASYRLSFGVWASGTDHLTIRNNVISGFTLSTLEGSKTSVGVALLLGYPTVSAPNGNNSNATIAGNKIGTDKDGVSAVTNYVGLICEKLTDSTIGGSADADRNIISGNGSGGTGVSLGTSVLGEVAACHNDTIQNNYFGTDVTGNNALPNGAALLFDKNVHDINFTSNIFGAGGGLQFKAAQAITISNNKIGIGANGTTRFNQDGFGVVSLKQVDDATVSGNQFGGNESHSLYVDTSTNITVDGNYFGTNSAKTASYTGMQEAVSVFNSSGVNVSNNTIRNVQANQVNKFAVANSPFAFGGNDYNEIVGSTGLTCLPGQKGLHTLYYSNLLGTVTTGTICTSGQVFAGITHITGSDQYLNSDVKAYLITKSGQHYTFLISQSAGGPFSCSTVVAAVLGGGGTCDKEFTLYSVSGSTFTAQSLPSGVTLATGASEPTMTKYQYPSGIAILGANGDTTIQGNEISSNESRGVVIIGGNDVVIDNNTITNNSDDGINLLETTANTVTKNTITDSGANGIELSKATNNTIGTAGNGNTITSETLNGIALTNLSDSNTVTANTAVSNGDSGTVNGAGVYVNASSSNDITDNDLHDNVRGVAITSTESIGSQHNTIGGGTIRANLSSGILIQDPRTQNNTIDGATISGNHAYGIDNTDTHSASLATPADGDNTITNNTISLNSLSGIRNYGASPKITSNTFNQNTNHGVYTVVDYGTTTNPDTASDDVLSIPTIGGSGSENHFNGNAQYGIYSLDTAPSNKNSLDTDNGFDTHNVSGNVRQDWYGLVEAIGTNNAPEGSATIKLYGHNVSDPFTEFTTATTGYGPSSASTTDVQTWQVIPEFIVSPSGTKQEYAPHLIVGQGSAGTATFSFNGATLGSSSPFGNINGRYQVASVTLLPNPNTIQGTVYNDVNKNGTNDSETGIENITARVYKDDGNGTYGTEDSLIETDTTDANGAYTLSNLSKGSYFVSVTGEPTGFVKTTDNPSSKITFSNADGGQVETQNFGFAESTVIATTPKGTIKGMVYKDVNKNKTVDTDENGIPDVTLHLFKDTNENSTFDAGTDTEISTSTTNANGEYTFNNLPLATYFLSFTLPVDYSLTTANNPTDKEVLATDSQTITVNFGLVTTSVTPPPPKPQTKPDHTPPPVIIKIISGATTTHLGGVLTSNANVANTTAATAAAGVGLVNLLLATPGAAWPAFLRLLADLFSEPLLALFGSKKLPWGRLFNAVTKRPIDLGLVRLYDSRTRTLVGTAVTDATGRFKFLPKPGVYTAKATKANFAFPSTLLAAAPTYEKKNFYFGDSIRIDDQNQAFTKDIPLDPPEASKDIKDIIKLRAKETLHTVIAFSGIAVSIVNVVLVTTPLTIGLLLLHAVLLIIFWRLALPAKPKPWGRVYDVETKKPVKGAVVRIYDQRFGRLLDTAISDRNGRYGFLVGAADYSLTVEAKDYQAAKEKKNSNDYVGGPIHVAHEKAAVSADLPLIKSSSSK